MKKLNKKQNIMNTFLERQQAEQFLSNYTLDLEVSPEQDGQAIEMHENITENYQIFIDYNFSYDFHSRPATHTQPDESYYQMTSMEITKIQIFNNEHEEIELSEDFEKAYINKMETLYIKENADR